MRKRLSTIGNSLGIVIEKPLLELLRINKETELDISTDGTRLIVEPVRRVTPVIASAETLRRLSGCLQLGGDALDDTETLYDRA